jgi:hypothetical protein
VIEIDPTALAARIERAKDLLLTRRSAKALPHRDEKIIASWNGMMLAGYAEAAMAFDRQDYLETAVDNAKFLTEVMYKDGRLCHSYKDGRGTGQSYLQDYAFVCDGLIRLYEASFDEHWLSIAINLADNIDERYWNEGTRSFYDTDKNEQGLLIRPRNMYDNALPSGSSAAAMVLLYLSRLADNSRYEYIALLAMGQALPLIAQYALGFGHWLCAIDFYISEPKEVVLAGALDDAAARSFANIIAGCYLPNVIQARVDHQKAFLDIPLLKDRAMIDDRPTVYICEKYTCKAPVTNSSELESSLRELT